MPRKTRKKKKSFLKVIFVFLCTLLLSFAIFFSGRIILSYFQPVSAGEYDVEDVSPDEKEIDSEFGDDDNENLTTEGNNDNENPIIENNKDNENPNLNKGDNLVSNGDTNSNEKTLVTDIENILVVVNKANYIPADYKPNDLMVPNVRFSFEGEHEKKYMRVESAIALETLFSAAEDENIYLYAVSGYRSYATQERLFKNRADRVGEEEANKLSARPGESEHQTGLAMDVTSKGAGFDLIEAFGETEEGVWLKENAHKFGFIIRYLKEKTEITGYSYEPWHIRYVGNEVAEFIYNEGITLEEYFLLDQSL